MNPPRFTPAPWRDHANRASITIVAHRPGGDVTVASLPRPEHGPSRERQEANARLIAAAPELYAACKYVDEWLMAGYDDADADNDNYNSAFRRALKAVRAALAAAAPETEGGAA
jgi:hypothetical protein